eukprot:750275-Hanusia_phi.AAC.1
MSASGSPLSHSSTSSVFSESSRYLILDVQTSRCSVDVERDFLSGCSPSSDTQLYCSIGRQISRNLWQPNSEADTCSILTCGRKFSRWSAGMKHHCRSCGRIVCSACSSGTRLMLPCNGESGPARNVRVCNACLHYNNTFSFKRQTADGAG